MNINNMVNAKAGLKPLQTEENVQRGKTSYEKTAEREQSATIKAVAYEGSTKTAQAKGQKGLDSGIYNPSGEKEEKTIAEQMAEKREDAGEAMDRTADRMTEEDCQALEEEGMTLESYEAERLSRALDRIKENRQSQKDNVELRVDRQEEYDQEIQKIALKNKISDSTARKLGQKLIEAGLPVTEANIMAMVQALDMGSTINSLPDSGMAYMIENGQEATIENLYHASYAGGAQGSVSEEIWEQVQAQVEAVIEKSGQPVTQETLENGKWLLDHQLPVTEETLEELENLKEIRADADEEYLLNRMTEAITRGKEPKEANLDIETVQTRRRLEEIRLSMSEEASRSLEEKGIVIDTEHMKEVIEELKKLENSYYKALLSEAGEETSAEKTQLLKDTLEKAESVGKSPAYVLGRTLETRHHQTLETLYQEGEALKQQAAKAAEAYEPLWTAPRADMGDSIQKAFQNTEVLLSELGLENTRENQRAVRILGYNRMDITEENINNVKAYDAKVNGILDGLKPAAAVELIRRGENPLHMPLEELKQTLDGISAETGATEEEKYSTYLWRLEKQEGAITPEERKSYIGIYRLLNNIEKTDGAAIGNVLHAGKELTLSNLLTAVRTIKNKGVNQKIDDGFGGLSELSFYTESISDQIETAFSSDSRTEYLQELVSRTLGQVVPEQVKEVLEGNDGYAMDMSLEKFCEEVMVQEPDNGLTKSYQREQMESFRETAQNAREAVAFLEAFGTPAVVKNIQAVQAWFTGDKNLFKELDEKADTISEEKKAGYRQCAQGLLEAMGDEEDFGEEYQKAADVMRDIAASGFSNTELVSEEAEVLQLMQKGIALASRMSRQEHYEMPIVIGDEVSSLSLTIVKGTRESGKAQIRIDFPEQGAVEATLTIKKDEIKGFILCETTEGQKLIEDCLDDVKQGFEELGLTVKQLTAGADSKAAKRSLPENIEEKPTQTRQLYQAARILVKKTIERTQVTEYEN